MFEDIQYFKGNSSYQLFTNNTLYRGYTGRDTFVIYTLVPYIAASIYSSEKISCTDLPNKKQIALYKLSADPSDLIMLDEHFPILVYDLVECSQHLTSKCRMICSTESVYIGSSFNKIPVELT